MTANVDERAFSPKRYARLLTETLPRAIESEEGYDRMLAPADELEGREPLPPEEERLLEMLAILIEDYEDKHYQLKESSPLDIPKFLMGQHDLKPKDLWPLFGSTGLTSEVLNGKRRISRAKAKKLGERFNVSPDLFISYEP